LTFHNLCVQVLGFVAKELDFAHLWLQNRHFDGKSAPYPGYSTHELMSRSS
jgi:hypothetical protein